MYSTIKTWLITLRNLCISYTHTKYAELILYCVSFIESFIFPIPPDILLLPMSFARPSYSFRYAFGATISSVLGGAIGYAIGFFFFASIGLWIIQIYSLQSIYESAKILFEQYGVITMLIAGITPIPYKLATILAGMFVFNFPLFLITSFIGRGIRFFAIALLPHIADTTLGRKIQKNLGIVLLFVVALLVGVVLLYSALNRR